MTRRRRPQPHQGDRLGQSLSEQADHEHRQSRQLPAHLDGDGRLLKDISFAGSSDTTVQHNLGRLPRGFQVVYVKGTATTASHNIFEIVTGDADGTSNRSKTEMTLHNSSAQTVFATIWVF